MRSPPRGRDATYEVMVAGRVDGRGAARIRSRASFNAATFSRAIKSTWDIEVRAVLATPQRVFTAATFDAAPIAEVA